MPCAKRLQKTSRVKHPHEDINQKDKESLVHIKQVAKDLMSLKDL